MSTAAAEQQTAAQQPKQETTSDGCIKGRWGRRSGGQGVGGGGGHYLLFSDSGLSCMRVSCDAGRAAGNPRGLAQAARRKRGEVQGEGGSFIISISPSESATNPTAPRPHAVRGCHAVCGCHVVPMCTALYHDVPLCAAGVLYVAAGWDPYDLIERGVAAAAALSGGARRRVDKVGVQAAEGHGAGWIR